MKHCEPAEVLNEEWLVLFLDRVEARMRRPGKYCIALALLAVTFVGLELTGIFDVDPPVDQHVEVSQMVLGVSAAVLAAYAYVRLALWTIRPLR